MCNKKIDDENRKCLYCGTNIGYKQLSAKVCDNLECIKKLLADIRKNPIKDKQRNCVICGCDISLLPSLAKTCQRPECKKEKLRLNYKLHHYKKTCKICKLEFIGTQKQTVCNECKKTSVKRRFDNIKKIEQKVLCKLCGKLIRINIKNNTKKVKDTIYEVCDDCKKIYMQQVYRTMSERMKVNNPMFDKNIAQKVGNSIRNNYIKKCESIGKIPNDIHIKKSVKETKADVVKRMKENNPMFNKKTVEKMKLTLQEHILNGTITYKKGIEHHLWKGNRLLNKAVRIALKQWIKYMFKKYEYTCQICGKTNTELHVHHIMPLRNIITNFLTKYDYTTEYLQSIEGTDIYNEFIQNIVLFHLDNEDIGIVVCPDCHYKIDKYYNRKKHE